MVHMSLDGPNRQAFLNELVLFLYKFFLTLFWSELTVVVFSFFLLL